MKVTEIKIWFTDESLLELEGERAANATAELFKYSREGKPRFIDMGEGRFYSAATVDAFYIKEIDL